jgi:transcriptional regulator with XRE-family HTH domain
MWQSASVNERRSTISEQLKAAILAASESRYRIAQETGVTEAALSRFVNGKRLLDLSSVDKLASYLRLELVPAKKQRKGR